MKSILIKNLRLCLVTHIKNHSLPQYKQFIQHTVRGGVTMVQLREKADIQKVKLKALELQSLLKPMGIPLIINDFVELAAEIDADGVHIGQNDVHPTEAIKILGPHKIIGLSIESLDELYEANKINGITYITASAIFPSRTKPECKTLWGRDGLKQVIKNSVHPVTAIGGINNDNISSIINVGACGVAVVEAIHNAHNPYTAALSLRRSIDKALLRSDKKRIHCAIV